MILVGKQEIGFAVRNADGELLAWDYVPYDSKTPWEHRQKICKKIDELNDKYIFDTLIFEKINLYRGGFISHLSGILSLCRVQSTIIDKYSSRYNIYQVNVQSWKSKILGSAKATKEDAINYVHKNYPDVNTDVEIIYKRKENEIVDNHDMCDAICISELINYPEFFTDKDKMNWL